MVKLNGIKYVFGLYVTENVCVWVCVCVDRMCVLQRLNMDIFIWSHAFGPHSML